MQRTAIGKHLGDNRQEVYEEMREHLRKTGQLILHCEIPDWQHRDQITYHDIFHLQNCTVDLEGRHENIGLGVRQYRYFKFEVAGSSEAEENKMLSELESLVEKEKPK
jgi:hypothetical protein